VALISHEEGDEDGLAAAEVAGRLCGPQPALMARKVDVDRLLPSLRITVEDLLHHANWSSSERHARNRHDLLHPGTVTWAIKIGYSANPQKRLKHLQNSNQNKLADRKPTCR
jgi:hypothetical protein